MCVKNKKPMDIGFAGTETRNTRHEAEFHPPDGVEVYKLK